MIYHLLGAPGNCGKCFNCGPTIFKLPIVDQASRSGHVVWETVMSQTLASKIPPKKQDCRGVAACDFSIDVTGTIWPVMTVYILWSLHHTVNRRAMKGKASLWTPHPPVPSASVAVSSRCPSHKGLLCVIRTYLRAHCKETLAQWKSCARVCVSV